MKYPRYHVLTRTVCEGLVNCWILTDQHGNETLQTFNSYDEAEHHLNEHLQDMIDNGMTILEVADLVDDYEIEEIT